MLQFMLHCCAMARRNEALMLRGFMNVKVWFVPCTIALLCCILLLVMAQGRGKGRTCPSGRAEKGAPSGDKMSSCSFDIACNRDGWDASILQPGNSSGADENASPMLKTSWEQHWVCSTHPKLSNLLNGMCVHESTTWQASKNSTRVGSFA